MAERPKVEANIYLVCFIPLLILCTKFVPKLSSWSSKKYFRPTSKEVEQIATAMEIRKEMNSISMVKEFVKYSKLQRKLNQVTMDLESSAKCRELLQDRFYKWIMGFLCVVIGVVYIAVLGFVGTSTPVFVGPKFWYYPLDTLLAYPTGVAGAVSIPMWTVLTRNVLSHLIKT